MNFISVEQLCLILFDLIDTPTQYVCIVLLFSHFSPLYGHYMTTDLLMWVFSDSVY